MHFLLHNPHPLQTQIIAIVAVVGFIVYAVWLRGGYRRAEAQPSPAARQQAWRSHGIKVGIFFFIILLIFTIGMLEQKVSVLPIIGLFAVFGVGSYLNVAGTFFCKSCSARFRCVSRWNPKIKCPDCGFCNG